MYYLTQKLHLIKGNPLVLQVVKVEQGRVVSYFDFRHEMQSMMLVDEMVLSENDSLDETFSLQSLPAKAPDIEKTALSAYLMTVSPAGVRMFKRLF